MKVAQSCLTLWNPMDYTVHGILQARIIKWVAISFSRGSSQPSDWIQVFSLQVGTLPTEPPGNPFNLQTSLKRKQLFRDVHDNKLGNFDEIAKFLKWNNLSKVTQEKINNPNSPFSLEEVVHVTKNRYTKKNSENMALLVNTTKLWKNKNLISTQALPQKWNLRHHPMYSMSLAWSWNQTDIARKKQYKTKL